MVLLRERVSPALRVGILFGLIGLALTAVGIARGNVPLNPASIAMALLIGGGVWFVVSWAVATAAADVEEDLAQVESASDAPNAAQTDAPVGRVKGKSQEG